jgi:hypothetical protein
MKSSISLNCPTTNRSPLSCFLSLALHMITFIYLSARKASSVHKAKLDVSKSSSRKSLVYQHVCLSFYCPCSPAPGPAQITTYCCCPLADTLPSLLCQQVVAVSEKRREWKRRGETDKGTRIAWAINLRQKLDILNINILALPVGLGCLNNRSIKLFISPSLLSEISA